MRANLFLLFVVTGILLPDSQPQAQTADDSPIGILLAAGDIANCASSRSRYKQVSDIIRMELKIAEEKNIPAKVIALGDIAYAVRNRRSYAECLIEFDVTWSKFKDHILPVPGNHDYSDDRQQDAGTYFSYFDDFYDTLDKKAPNGSYIVSFPSGYPDAWSLIGFNFYQGRNQELRFLQSNLPSVQGDCAIGFSHPLLNSSGNHGSRLEDLTYKRMQPFFDMLLGMQAEAMIVAHDHHFEQFKPIGPNLQAGGGLRQFVVGTGGAPLYTREADPRHPASEFFTRTAHGVLRLNLFPDRFSWSFLQIDGNDPIVLPVTSGRC